MGMNLMSCCHKCKKKFQHLRGQENLTILQFYKKHSNCILENMYNVGTFEDQIQEKNWMRASIENGGYETDEEIQNLVNKNEQKQRQKELYPSYKNCDTGKVYAQPTDKFPYIRLNIVNKDFPGVTVVDINKLIGMLQDVKKKMT